MGRSAFFIRTFGCPLHCTFCDAAGTWHPDHIPTHIERMESTVLVEEALVEPKVDFVVITGGEPCIHDLYELTILFAYQLPCHLETSGAYKIRGYFDWVTLSPKRSRPPILEAVVRANEFKFIIEEPGDIEFFTNMIENVLGRSIPRDVPVWLHPEWSKREDPTVLNAITNAVSEYGSPFRAGWQLHKLFRCDQQDSRSMPPVPLGGDVKKGF
jgi:7-carboxy-7-deazaguanine synthase